MKKILAALVVMGTTAALLLTPAPTDAAVTATPKGKIITPRNADVIATCKFQVNRLSHGDVYYTLTANARPADFDGYRANAYTQVNCYLLPAGDTDPNDALAEIHPSVSSATLLSTSSKGTVAYADSYTLCGYGMVKLKNGDSSFTPYVCA